MKLWDVELVALGLDVISQPLEWVRRLWRFEEDVCIAIGD